MKHPIVFLLGAGATRGALQDRPIPPPLDSDFFEIALQIKGHGIPTLVKTVLKDVWSMYGRTNGIGLEAYYREIEAREKIGRFTKTKHKPKDWKRRKDQLNELIRRVIIHTTCDEYKGHYRPHCSKLHGLLTDIAIEGDTIITFNYDTLIEESNSVCRNWTPVGGYGRNIQGHKTKWAMRWFTNKGIPTSTKSPIKLLKLHGSLNWTSYINRQVRLKPRPYVARTRNGSPVYEKVSILAPGWNKQIDKKPFSELWKDARRYLEGCSSLVIVGYSLPETDLVARALIAEVVRARVATKRYLKELHLAEPDLQTSSKFIDLFTPALGYAGRIVKYHGLKEFVDKSHSLDVR